MLLTIYHTPSSNWPTTEGNIINGGPSKAPIKADLINALVTIVLVFNGTASPSIGTIYYPDVAPTGVTLLTTGLFIVKIILPEGTREREIILGLKLTLTSCTGVVSFKGDRCMGKLGCKWKNFSLCHTGFNF